MNVTNINSQSSTTTKILREEPVKASFSKELPQVKRGPYKVGTSNQTKLVFAALHKMKAQLPIVAAHIVIAKVAGSFRIGEKPLDRTWVCKEIIPGMIAEGDLVRIKGKKNKWSKKDGMDTYCLTAKGAPKAEFFHDLCLQEKYEAQNIANSVQGVELYELDFLNSSQTELNDSLTSSAKKSTPIIYNEIIRDKKSSSLQACALVRANQDVGSQGLKKFKRWSDVGASISEFKEKVRTSTRGTAQFTCYDDISLRASLKEVFVDHDNGGFVDLAHLHRFCTEHMLKRGLIPDYGYRDRLLLILPRMPLLKKLQRETRADIDYLDKNGFNKGWLFRKGDGILPFADPFSSGYDKEKKRVAAKRKESNVAPQTDFIPGSTRPKEFDSIYKNSSKWIVKKTDARSLRNAQA